jgi:L-fucose isomerase-like protein
MARELGADGNHYPELLPKLAQFEITLLDWAEAHKGARKYVAFADKCWPAFPKEFGFEPCYVNSRLASRGMPVGCEVDIYGALSEYIGACVTADAVTILDINNSVPKDLYDQDIKGKFGYDCGCGCGEKDDYKLCDTFMGFHCGNTPVCKLRQEKNTALKYQLINNRLMEGGKTPDITRGTMEGDIVPGPITFYRLHANADGKLQAYVAQGEVLPVPTHSFGGIGVFAIPEMRRFYRYVLIGKHYPHHGAVAFGHVGKTLWDIFQYLGVSDISFNQGPDMLYKDENPFNGDCGPACTC